MSKRKPNPPTGSGTPLTGARLAMAYELARHGIAQLLPDMAIVTSIVEQCKTTERSASAALQKVARQGAKLSPQDQAALRDTIHFRLEHLYAQAAQTGKIETAAKMLDRRARLEGLYINKPEEKPLENEQVDEFDGRSLEDIVFYREHGYMPEDRPASNVVPLDPLAKLRKKANG